MRQFRNVFVIVMALALASPVATAQDATTQGKEFWLSFISNGFKNHPTYGTWLRVQLLVSAKRSCEGTITNPNTGWTHQFTVEANDIFSMDLDETQVYIEASEHERIVNKGLQIITTDTVSVYCANLATYSFDASYVLPSQSLADDYIIQTHEQSMGVYDPTSAFVIVATEDNTVVDITPSVATLGGRPANEEFNITLNKGEAFQVRSNEGYTSRDLSGTRVTARDCKKIAVFNGNNLTLVPASATSDQDCIFEQAMPLQSWGKKFVVTTSRDRSSDYVKITSASDGNEIRRNGQVLTTLNANQSYSFELMSSQKSCYLESLHPCAVYLYNTSSNGNGNGAPSMLWIAPIEQRIDEITFSTFNYDHDNVNITNHYVNIIVESQDIDKVHFDNDLLPSNQFEAVQGTEDYSFCRRQITHGVHHLSCPNGFNAHVYGFGDARGYAYMVGSKATDLSTTISINHEVAAPNDTITNCALEMLDFEADINLNNYTLIWDFGDGTTSTDNPSQHTYDDYTFYKATLTVNTEENPCGGSSTSNTYSIFIDARKEPDSNYSDNICAGELYSGYGFSNVLITRDTILTREQPGVINPECTSLVNVEITCYPVSDTTINDLVCFKGPDTYTDNGFSFSYSSPGTYPLSRISPNQYGCDRTIHLNLVVGDVTEGSVENESGHCDFFEWNGNIYYESGQYSDTIANEDGCYAIEHLDLDLDYSPTPTPIFPSDSTNAAPHWVITSTEFQVNSYDFTLWDENPHCEWDTVIWSIENSEATWVLEPFGEIGEKCKVYVLNRVEDTVWLTANVFNGCGDEIGVERRYWFVCSFYGIDEQVVASQIDIAPNPNNGEMSILIGEMEGEVEAKVYDMHGILVDQFEFYATEQSRYPYSFDGRASGVYMLVFNINQKAIAKKAVVIR
ncbi:MAG: T9SS type A sorting domain-containing protein [Bacteroidales bacterium]|nr:T9SS type A sorting domain-containing protein [Bacteroidales bacterium]